MSKHFTKPFNPIQWPAVPHDFTGDNNLGIYAKETTQRYVYGTRYITWDGRVYKYMGVTTAGCNSRAGVCNTLEAPHGWTANAVEVPAGGRLASITKTGVAEDQYAGALLLAYNATHANSTQHNIVGNTASGATYTDLYLEFPLPVALDATDTFELFANSYRKVEGTASRETHAWLGIPCVTAVDGQNVWVQTWGPCVITPGNTTFDDAAANERQAFWMGNGTLGEVGEAAITAGEQQIAGYILNAGTPDIAGPEIYLMCSS